MIYKTDVIFKDSLINVYKISHQNDIIATGRDKNHSHEYMQIWYIIQGRCCHIMEGVRYELPTKSLLVIPPYVTHFFENESYDIIIIGCEFPVEVITDDIILKKNAKESPLKFIYEEVFETAVIQAKPCYIPMRQCQIQVEGLLENMLKEYLEKNDYYKISLKSDLLKFLICLARDYASNPNDKKISKNYVPYINSALEYIKENYQSKIYIKDAATAAQMSESYFSYFFKEVTGQTFVEYLNFMRIEKAKELLKNSSMPTSQIGHTVGFNEISYFITTFKKLADCTPARYRAEWQNIDNIK